MARSTNVATFTLAPGYSDFKALCVEAGILDSSDQDPIEALPTGVISDDEESTASAEPRDDMDDDASEGGTTRADSNHNSVRPKGQSCSQVNRGDGD